MNGNLSKILVRIKRQTYVNIYSSYIISDATKDGFVSAGFYASQLSQTETRRHLNGW